MDLKTREASIAAIRIGNIILHVDEFYEKMKRSRLEIQLNRREAMVAALAEELYEELSSLVV